MDTKLEIRHLRLLQAITDEGGVTSASRRLHLTQSALSHQLRDAEERLGTPLFVRTKRRMVLTEAGEQLLGTARRVLRDLEAGENAVRSAEKSGIGRIRLSTECYTCYHWLPPVLRRFGRRFPRVEVTIDVDSTRRTVPAVLDGTIDVGIVSSEPQDARLRLQTLFQDELVAVIPPGHRLASCEYVRPQDFGGETLFAYSAKADNRVVQRLLVPEGVTPKAIVPVQLTEAIVELVKAGLGVAVLARWAVAPLVASGSLVARRITKSGLKRRWQAASLAGTPPPEFQKAFLDLIGRHAFPARA